MSSNNIEKMLSDALFYQNKGKYNLAIEIYNQILVIDNKNYAALNNLSVLYINTANLKMAETVLLRLVNSNQLDVNVYNHLAVVYMRTFRLDSALQMLEYAIAEDPFLLQTYLNLTNVCSLMKDEQKALHYALEAIKINPTSSNAFNNLGSVLNSMAKFEEAKLCFETAVDLDKNNIEAFINLGSTQVHLSDTLGAINTFEKGLKRLPKKAASQSDVIKFLLSFEYLKTGRLKQGWEFYDCGFHPNIPVGNARSKPRTFRVPRWIGQPIPNKKLLVWREQGLGDEMMFLSIMPDLIKMHRDIILEVDNRLVEPIQRSFPEIIVRQERFGSPPYFEALDHDYDFHVPLGSLMRYLRPSIDSFKNSGPYLTIDSEKKSKFKERLASYKDKLLIGICWRSGNIDALRALTYVGIMKWGELFAMENVAWVNLQYGECEEECLAAEKEFGIEIIRWKDVDLKNDLDDIFALMSELSAVVTVATAVHHMAAATGCKTLLITPKGAWNRFHLDYDPWFPNLHPFISEDEKLETVFPLIKNYLVSKCKNYLG